MAQISYTNKVALNENPEILDINKVTDDDMNEIKQVVNDNYNNTIQITDTEPSDSDNKLWIDTGEVQNLGSEIESGSNANGNWTKFADGTMICIIRKTITVAINQAWGNLYTGEVPAFTYPVAFVSSPTVNYTVSGGNSAMIMPWIGSTDNNTLTDRMALVRGATTTSQNYIVNITAIGRWK